MLLDVGVDCARVMTTSAAPSVRRCNDNVHINHRLTHFHGSMPGALFHSAKE